MLPDRARMRKQLRALGEAMRRDQHSTASGLGGLRLCTSTHASGAASGCWIATPSCSCSNSEPGFGWKSSVGQLVRSSGSNWEDRLRSGLPGDATHSKALLLGSSAPGSRVDGDICKPALGNQNICSCALSSVGIRTVTASESRALTARL